MSYQALARKYRPQTFADVIGQETVVRTLQNAIEHSRIHHAYLFSGVRGVGKTTAARILAKALNCVHGPTAEPCNECSICREITEGIDLDVREIDAATYTQVDNIRELREVTQFQPARDRYRIFIIDEAHMLSTGAWNALLKLIEEPPPHVAFILATTEMHKVPATIISRVQRFTFRKITVEELIARLESIAGREGISADRAALEIIARRGEGSVRDSLSLLDQIIAFSGRAITAADVAAVLGLSDTTFFSRIVAQIAEGNPAEILNALQEASDSGRDFKMLYRDLLSFVRNLLLIAGGARESMLSAAPEDLAILKDSANAFGYSELLRIANLLLRDDETVNRAEHQRLAVEVALLKAATFPRLRAVEQILTSGAAPGAAPGQAEAGRSAPPSRATQAPSHAGRAPSGGQAPRAPEVAVLDVPPRKGSPAAAASGPVEELIARVQAAKPIAGTYLSGAKETRIEGDRVIVTFDESQRFFAESLSDESQRRFLQETATTVLGRPVKVEIEVAIPTPAPSGRRDGDQPAPAEDDPVVKAFAKHLGGEVVKGRR